MAVQGQNCFDLCGYGHGHRVAHSGQGLADEPEPELDVLVDDVSDEGHRAEASNEAPEEGQDGSKVDTSSGRCHRPTLLKL